MDAPFPFGFPLPTAVYLTLLVATWVLHVVFMHYVLGGSVYLALRTLVLGNRSEDSTPATLLREWLPFLLSAAITAGIAPLLFAQVAYQQRFYTANLLLFYRWMAILPALLIAFYMLYLLKARAAVLRRTAFRVTAKLTICACVLYVAWLWTMNHLLSLQGMEVWARQYAAGTVAYRTVELLPRLGFWLASAFPTLAVWLAWQSWFTIDEDQTVEAGRQRGFAADELRQVAGIALAGLGLMCVLAIVYARALPTELPAAVTGRLAGGFLIACCVGVAVQFGVWITLCRAPRLTAARLWLLTAGLAATLLGIGVCREAIRLARVDIAGLYAAHEAAWSISGKGAFAVVFLLNTALMIWCVRIAQRARR